MDSDSCIPHLLFQHPALLQLNLSNTYMWERGHQSMWWTLISLQKNDGYILFSISSPFFISPSDFILFSSVFWRQRLSAWASWFERICRCSTNWDVWSSWVLNHHSFTHNLLFTFPDPGYTPSTNHWSTRPCPMPNSVTIFSKSWRGWLRSRRSGKSLSCIKMFVFFSSCHSFFIIPSSKLTSSCYLLTLPMICSRAVHHVD